MWLKDLNMKRDDDKCYVNNILILISAINDIRLPEFVVKEGQSLEKYDGFLAFDESGKGLFISNDDMEQCRKKYLSLTHH